MARSRRACAACDGQRLNPVALHVRFRDRSSPTLTAQPIAQVARVLREALALQPRKRRSRATCWRRSGRAWPSWSASAWAIWRWTARRRRCRAAKRSASGSPRSSARTCRACATCSTSRPSACIRATTTCCSMRWPSSRRNRNTLVVVEHDEDTIRRADHVIDLGPGAGVRGGEVVGAGHGARADARIPTRSPGAFCASRCGIRASAARDRRAHAAARARSVRAAQRRRTWTCAFRSAAWS